MNVLAVIPARGGSKGIPKKNLAPCGGKPLAQWTIDAANESKLVTHAVLSSDDPDILALADGKVVAQHRPAVLAQDDTPTEAVIGYVVKLAYPDPDLIVLLQPTSPIRTGEQIDEAIQLVTEREYDSVFSAVRSHSFLWYGPLKPNYNVRKRPRRQELAQAEENGSIYVFTRRLWEKTHNRLGGRIGMCAMPEETRYQVDTPLDLAIVDFLLRRRVCQGQP